jgi:hypothetical protein
MHIPHFVRFPGIFAALLALPLQAQVEFTLDGEPSTLEEEIRWLMNRARFDTASENQTRGTSYTDVPSQAPPVAPIHPITLAARHHSEDLALNNLFTHSTVPDSSYYDASTQPRFSDRMRAEGYSGSPAGENIAAGYPSAEAAYRGWWNSDHGHRPNMMNGNHRDVGNGYFYLSGSQWRHYYTMDLGRSGSTYFFTGTLFHDANQNGAYNQDESKSGIRVTLLVDGSLHPECDVSAPAGNFAVPIETIAPNTIVEVHLNNPSSQPVTLDIPANYHDSTQIQLAPAETQVFGVFRQPATLHNLGLRDVTPLPPLAISESDSNWTLSWPSTPNVPYRAQWSENLADWTDLTPSAIMGNGDVLQTTDSNQLGPPRFYRIQVGLP